MITCPNCGYSDELDEFGDDDAGEMGWDCEQCGDHNTPVADECDSCGAPKPDWLM